MKDLLFGTRIVVRTSNIKISRHRVADYVKKKERKKFTKERSARAARLLLFLSSFNQPYHCFLALWLPLVTAIFQNLNRRNKVKMGPEEMKCYKESLQ